jgi:hypothetical protein
MRYSHAWKNSKYFGNKDVGVLAMCELINHPSLAGMPKYFFFIFLFF